MMGKERWSLLGRLRKAVKKIRFLLNFDMNRWKLVSMIGSTSSLSNKRRLSFNDRAGLRACMDTDDDDSVNFYSSAGSSSSRGIKTGGRLQRTISYPSDEDDIDKRAENFIANFYKQLQLERQISLELRYARENSFNSASPP